MQAHRPRAGWRAPEVRTAVVGPYATNAYALVCPATGTSVLVDPGADPDRLAALLEGTSPAAILLTHGHADHVGALEAMHRRLGVPVLAHPEAQFEGVEMPVHGTLADNERLTFGACALRARHAPGHRPDQLCFEVEAAALALVGDTVFAGGPGHTDSPADFRVTIETLGSIVLAWPDETLCLPGHGESFTVATIRRDVERFVARDHGDFCGDAVWER